MKKKEEKKRIKSLDREWIEMDAPIIRQLQHL